MRLESLARIPISTPQSLDYTAYEGEHADPAITIQKKKWCNTDFLNHCQ